MPPSTGAAQHAVITVVVTDVTDGSDRNWATNLAASVADTVRDRLGDLLDKAPLGAGHPARPGTPPVVVASTAVLAPGRTPAAAVAADQPSGASVPAASVPASGFPASGVPASGVPAAGIVVDRVARRVIAAGQPLHLTRREFELLAFLAEHPGCVFSRAELLRAVWNEASVGSRTVDVHVRRLRAKLGTEAHRLVTIRNVGYRIDTDGPGRAHSHPRTHPHDLEPVA